MNITPIDSLKDEPVEFKEDNTNSYDTEALAVYYKDKDLGYVPKGLNRVLRKLMTTHRVNAFITKINGTKQRPNVLVYIEVL